MARSLLSLLLLLLAAVAHAATSPSEFRPLKPPSYPLAVRSPFLNAWLPAGSESGLLPESSAVWWDGTPVTWGTSVQIDGALYSVFGQLVHDMAVQTEAKYTATHSLFKLNAGGVNITADFFSPVSPNNHIRHSLPFSYYTLAFESADGKPHDVKVFNEFGFNWAGQNNSLVCNYFSDQNDTIGYFTINTQEDIPFTVSKSNSDGSMATWGHAVFSTTLVKGLTVQSGPQNAVRAEFNSTGALNGTVFQSGDGRSITAFAHDLGSIQGQTNVTLAVGHVRDKAINYMGQIRTPYYRSAYPTLPSALSHFFEDYASALNESFTFDVNVTQSADTISSNYSSLLLLSARQMFGGLELTIPYDTLNTSDVLVFLKEISTDGNIQTTDVISPMTPGLWMLAPDWIGYLVQPLLDYQLNLLAVNNTPPYAIHDLGFLYPNATDKAGPWHQELQPVEESADMIMMVYSHFIATGNTNFHIPYLPLLSRWADYLQVHGLYPQLQLASTDAAGPLANMTELAIKAAIALAAYGKLTNNDTWVALGTSNAATIYNTIGTDPSKTHFLLTYNESTSSFSHYFGGSSSNPYGAYTLAYNLLMDVLLNTHVFPDAAFSMQSSFLLSLAASHPGLGMPLDPRVDWGKTDWSLWCAAYANTTTRSLIVEDVVAYVGNGKNTVPLGDRYWVEGKRAGYSAEGVKDRPTVGGHWAPLLVETLGKGPVVKSQKTTTVSSGALRSVGAPKWGMSVLGLVVVLVAGLV